MEKICNLYKQRSEKHLNKFSAMTHLFVALNEFEKAGESTFFNKTKKLMVDIFESEFGAVSNGQKNDNISKE